MSKEGNTPNQSILILRLLCGGYLIYTAWGLREAFSEGIVFIIGAIVFAVAGAIIIYASLKALVKVGGPLFKKNEEAEEESALEEPIEEDPAEETEEGEDNANE
ncbi:MAG: hypothetical protein IKJ99_06780 [Oscillospiraceae bacterium]|nr:hypothetical protein [Oscillospiraceae bacterium]